MVALTEPLGREANRWRSALGSSSSTPMISIHTVNELCIMNKGILGIIIKVDDHSGLRDLLMNRERFLHTISFITASMVKSLLFSVLTSRLKRLTWEEMVKEVISLSKERV